MNCPVCTTVSLALAERQGIEIDYCPTCRGVWLDRGELDKVIERAESANDRPAPPSRSRDDHDDDDRQGRALLGRRGEGSRRGRRESILGELFDFG